LLGFAATVFATIFFKISIGGKIQILNFFANDFLDFSTLEARQRGIAVDRLCPGDLLMCDTLGGDENEGQKSTLG
jgi:hypothetical protein